MNITPYIDYLQVVPLVEEEQTTEGGIILTTSANEIKQKMGIVVAVGSGLPDAPVKTPIGDVVLYHEGNQQEFLVDGESIFFIREAEVVASLGNYEQLGEQEE